MLCSTCHKEIISNGEEIYIKDLTICKICVKEIENRCHYPIYKYDLVYEAYFSQGFSWYVNASRSKKVIQCQGCYKKGLVKANKEKQWWKRKKRWLTINITALLISLIILILFREIEVVNLIACIIFFISATFLNVTLWLSPKTHKRF